MGFLNIIHSQRRRIRKKDIIWIRFLSPRFHTKWYVATVITEENEIYTVIYKDEDKDKGVDLEYLQKLEVVGNIIEDQFEGQ